MVEPTPENLLAATAYGASNMGRQFADLVKLVRDLHSPIAGNEARPMVCPTCRDSRGRRVAFPCEENARASAILGFRVDPAPFDALGIVLPEHMRLSPEQARAELEG